MVKLLLRKRLLGIVLDVNNRSNEIRSSENEKWEKFEKRTKRCCKIQHKGVQLYSCKGGMRDEED